MTACPEHRPVLGSASKIWRRTFVGALRFFHVFLPERVGSSQGSRMSRMSSDPLCLRCPCRGFKDCKGCGRPAQELAGWSSVPALSCVCAGCVLPQLDEADAALPFPRPRLSLPSHRRFRTCWNDRSVLTVSIQLFCCCYYFPTKSFSILIFANQTFLGSQPKVSDQKLSISRFLRQNITRS